MSDQARHNEGHGVYVLFHDKIIIQRKPAMIILIHELLQNAFIRISFMTLLNFMVSVSLFSEKANLYSYYSVCIH